MLKQYERQALKFTEEYRRRKLSEAASEQAPTVETFRQNRLDDKITREAAEKLLGHTPPEPSPSEEVEPAAVPDDGLTLIAGDFRQDALAYQNFYNEMLAKKDERAPSAFDHWQRRQRGYVPDEAGELADYQLVLHLQSLDEKTRYQFTLQGTEVPEGSRVKPDVYELSVERIDGNDPRTWARMVIPSRYIRVQGERFDVSTIAELPDEEVQALYARLNAPVPPPPVPAPPTFRRSQRQPGDSASRLGIVLGASDGAIKFSRLWGWHAFHQPYPAVLGSIRADLELNYPPDHLEVRLYDAFGKLLLRVEVRGTTRFDEILLPAGDYVIAWKSSVSSGQGSYRNAHTGLLRNGLPERPLLDALLAAPPLLDDLTQQPVPITMPRLTFAAD